MALNIKNGDKKNILLELIKQSDVFVHSLRPQAIENLGLSYKDVKEINPNIIYCGLYGYGKGGDYHHKPAYDDTIQAASGLAAIQGKMAGEPQYFTSVVADKVTGLFAANAILAALYHRNETGEGQEIEVPMFETMVSFSLIEHLYGLTFNPPLGDSIYPRATSPYRKPYKTKDGYIGALVYSDKQWKSFLKITNNEELLSNPMFENLQTRTENINEIYQILERILATKTTKEWLEIFENADVPCMPVNGPEDLLQNNHLKQVKMFENVKHPTEGEIINIRSPIKFSKTPIKVRHLAPRLGENTDVIIDEYSLDTQSHLQE